MHHNQKKTDAPAEDQPTESDRVVVVLEPKPSDILCGKDKSCVSHEGSVRFRRIIEQYREKYCSDSTNKQEKMNITKEIVAKLSRSSRFLKYDCKRKVWRTISALAARDKVSHALRFANLKENRKTGKVKQIRRRVSASSASSNSSPTAHSSPTASPSPEETELWNSLLSRQTKLLESIKNGEKPDNIPAFVELPKPGTAVVVEPDETSRAWSGDLDPDLDPLSINDSSYEVNPVFQDYCLQWYRSEETNDEQDFQGTTSQVPSQNNSVRENLADAFNCCEQRGYDYHPFTDAVSDEINPSEACLYEDHSEDSEVLEVISHSTGSDNIGGEIDSVINEPLMTWDVEHDGIFEV